MDDTGGVKFLGAIVGSLHVDARAALVAEAPEDDGGEVAVAHHHSFHAVHELRLPALGAGDGVAALFPVVVALDVCLIHAVESVVVKHTVHLCLTGIVAAANGVDVGLLHDLHVAQHGGDIDGATVNGVRVLCVHAFEEHGFSIDIDLSALDADVAETVFRGECHLFVAVSVGLTDFDRVERGRLCAPELQSAQRGESERSFFLGLTGSKVHLGALAANLFAGGREKGGDDVFGDGGSSGVLHFQTDLERAGSVVGSGKRGTEEVVLHVGFGCGVEIDVAVNAGHSPHVLSFQVGTVGEADDAHGDVVFSAAHDGGEVKLGVVVGLLCVADIFSVNPDEGGGIDAVEVKHDTFVILPAFGQDEGAAIGGGRVHAAGTHDNLGIVVVEGRIDIDVIRTAVAFHLQAGGHGDGVPFFHVGVVAPELFLGSVGRSVGPTQFPQSVEGEPLCTVRVIPRLGIAHGVRTKGGGGGVGHEGGVGREFVLAEAGLVFPLVRLGQHLLGGLHEAEPGGL